MAKKYKYKIVVDSSANLLGDYIKDSQVGFEVVPLIIRVDDDDFIDDEKLDINRMLRSIHASKRSASTSCPSPYAFTKAYEDAENVICITLSSRLSGTFNAAFIGSAQASDVKVHVLDSKSTAGVMSLLVDEAYRLMKEPGLSFAQICEKMEEYNKGLSLLFVLDSFENLVKAGRISKIAAFVATSLSIKPLCFGDDGEIKVLKKLRTKKRAIAELVAQIGNMAVGFEKRVCIISYVNDKAEAEDLRKSIAALYPFKEIRIIRNRGLCSYYALEGGLLVSF